MSAPNAPPDNKTRSDTGHGAKPRKPGFTVETAAQLREQGAARPSVKEIVTDTNIRFAETLRRLGE
ncbi:hypothetical protein [Stappia sp.]|uniref:hypothetical protein n=1 Tax=Stappia sp. TaxID=1870903 RepID=UPI003D152CD2